MNKWIVVSLSALLICGCKASAPESVAQSDATATSTATSTATTFGERFDPDSHEVIATETLKAWRVAVKHAKKGGLEEAAWTKQRQADEKEAMTQLADLQQRFPQSSSVRFMMGQVEDHFGKHEEAIKHFHASIENNTHNSMYLFKLAESESKAGQLDKAISDYRLIIKHANGADVYPAELGLARALLKKDPNSSQAKSLLKKVLESQPDLKEAKELLNVSP